MQQGLLFCVPLSYEYRFHKVASYLFSSILSIFLFSSGVSQVINTSVSSSFPCVFFFYFQLRGFICHPTPVTSGNGFKALNT